jgi:purine-binding chemotaxis protein CheW
MSPKPARPLLAAASAANAASRLDVHAQASAATTDQLVTFLLGSLHFGVDVMNVQEVIRYQHMTRVPRAPAVVEGLINLRGQIVTAINMRTRVGLAARDAAHLPMNVVVRSNDGVASLLVDEIGEVVEVASDRLEPAPPTVIGSLRDLVTGVYQLRGTLLLKLDVERALTVDARHD